MRENTRERNSNSFGQNGRGDYREKLFSIFVDNLNHKADLLCLWALEWLSMIGTIKDPLVQETTLGNMQMMDQNENTLRTLGNMQMINRNESTLRRIGDFLDLKFESSPKEKMLLSGQALGSSDCYPRNSRLISRGSAGKSDREKVRVFDRKKKSHNEEWAMQEKKKEVREGSISRDKRNLLADKGENGEYISSGDLNALLIAMELEAANERTLPLLSLVEVKRNTVKIKKSLNSRGDKTHDLTNGTYWSLEVEITKVNERGVVLGYVVNSKIMEAPHCSKHISNDQVGSIIGGENTSCQYKEITETIWNLVAK
ncbi:hypothetical protein Ddye_004063 [Dipteronia dyeriana]|uniref:Uncharacterized protein n=1 Tax=Dipteronia dyeriana TaxID=168575 RepID=A0AAD9XTG9_9ROSI|nr:hypothetical protein Ddye_004063 [Dipteronia dyeriana]